MQKQLKRLDHDANTRDSIFQYYQTRALQLKPYGYVLEYISSSLFIINDADPLTTAQYYIAKFRKDSKVYWSFYLPLEFRGKGLSDTFAKDIKTNYIGNDSAVITIPDCNIETWLIKYNIPYVAISDHYSTLSEYVIMEREYGDAKARRSGLYLMNHIDEGANIMIKRNASEEAVKAFIAHPMLQDDEHFFDKKELLLNKVMVHCSKYTLLLCMEYRKVANAYLCKPETDGWTQEQIKFHCPILMDDIREMLIADKVQNYKDFLQFHALSHPRRNELFAYFNNWIDYLGCSSFANHWINKQNITVKLPVNY
jgi:hypothetical protein